MADVTSEPHHDAFGHDLAAGELKVCGHSTCVRSQSSSNMRKVVSAPGRQDEDLRHSDPLHGPGTHIPLMRVHAMSIQHKHRTPKKACTGHEQLARMRVTFLRHG